MAKARPRQDLKGMSMSSVLRVGEAKEGLSGRQTETYQDGRSRSSVKGCLHREARELYSQ